jgi:hypothetical protein
MKSSIEELCKSSFDEYLKSILSNQTFSWVEVRPDDEPPDFYLIINNNRFAIEVTTLMENIQVGPLVLSQQKIIQTLWRFIRDVESLAKSRELLHGAYTVTFTHAINNFKIVREKIQENILAYLSATYNLTEAKVEDIYRASGREIVRISKSHNNKNVIYPVGPIVTKWESEASVDIFTILEERITTKAEKLKNRIEPKILLLYDAYGFASPDMYYDCVSKLSAIGSFVMVFIISGFENNFVMYKSDENILT